MNLNSLRAHLQAQATEIDPATPVPLPTIHRQAQTLKRRRTATILTTATAAAVAVVIAVLPGAINNSTPDPVKPPPDFTRDGITIPGAIGPDRLEKAEVGKPGAGPLDFNWTPSGNSITFRPYCRATANRPLSVHVTVDGRLIAAKDCDDAGNSPRHEQAVPPSHVFWTEVTPGKEVQVRVWLADRQTGQADKAAAQLALGIYRSPVPLAAPAAPAVSELPVRSSAQDPGDYVKDGIRFRGKMGGDTLLNAAIGEVGQRSLKLRFTATSEATGLRLFCTGDRTDPYHRPTLLLRVDGRTNHPDRATACGNKWTDVSEDQLGPQYVPAAPGQTIEVTVDLVDNAGAAVSVSGARLGVAAYALGPQRLIKNSGGTTSIDEVLRHGGYTYKLAQVQAVPVKTTKELSIDVPAGKPYVIGYGGANLGAMTGEAKVLGLTRELSFELGESSPDGGLARWTPSYGQPAGPGGKVTLKVVSGKQTRGLLYLALYLPENEDR